MLSTGGDRDVYTRRKSLAKKNGEGIKVAEGEVRVGDSSQRWGMVEAAGRLRFGPLILPDAWQKHSHSRSKAKTGTAHGLLALSGPVGQTTGSHNPFLLLL